MLKRFSSTLDRTSSVLLTVLLFELMIGGGGRLTAVGPISLRMILFTSAIVVTFLHLLDGKRLPKEYVLLLGIFSGVVCVGWFIGLIHGSERSYLWEDVKPLCYFFILPFFHFSIPDEKMVSRISRHVQLNALLLVAAFFILLALIHSGLVPFLSFYHFLLPTEEFFFRGELTFFYKGFLYLSIGFIFIDMSSSRKWALWLIGTALLLTFTRGFWFALFATYSIYYAFELAHKFSFSAVTKLVACLMMTVLVLAKGQAGLSATSRWIDLATQGHQTTPQKDSSHRSVESLNPMEQPISQQDNSVTEERVVQKIDSSLKTRELNPRLLGDRAYSDDSRWRQIRQVLREMTLASVFVGHGMGQGIPTRPVHMEISYLEIFHKQGLLGLSFWLYLSFLLYRKFREATHPLAQPFFFTALFVFIQSLTNQYVNNPIGLSMVLLSLVCINKVQEGKKVN